MKAVGEHILIRVVKPEAETTKSGIVIPGATKINFFKGIVESVGEKCNKDFKGKMVYFSPQARIITIKDKDDMLYVIHADHVLLKE